MFKRRNTLKGITLIELMVAMTMSFLIFDALITIYLSAQKNQALQAALNSMQENAELAAQFLRRDIQSAGNIGCARLSDDFPVVNHTSYALTANNKIFGTNQSLTVRHASVKSATLLDTMRDNSSIIATADINFKAGDIVLISDCLGAEIFKIQKSGGDKKILKIIAERPLTRLYDKNSEVSRLDINTYFIKDTGRKTQNGKSVLALYLEDITKRKTELVEGIEDMQFNYDLDEEGGLVTRSADQVADWSKVLGVRVSLSVSSPDNVSLQKNWFVYVSI